MADGYGWLLNNCGDLDLAAHAEHLDEDRPEPGCVYCRADQRRTDDREPDDIE